MVLVQIKKQNQVTNKGLFDTEDDANAWISQEIANGSFGKPDRWVAEESLEAVDERQVLVSPKIDETLDDDGNVVSEAIPAVYRTEYLLPAEFSVEKIDLGIEPLLSEIRVKRNILLSQTDYTQLPDSPLSEKKRTEFAIYRQALRDLPETADSEGNVVWPDKPKL